MNNNTNNTEEKTGNLSFQRIDLDQGNFTILHNDIINDHSLDMAVRFLAIFLLSKPDTWHTKIKSLAKIFKRNKDTIAKYLNILEKAGYLKKEQKRNNKGYFAGYNYFLSSQKLETIDIKGSNPNPSEPDPVDTVNSLKPDPVDKGLFTNNRSLLTTDNLLITDTEQNVFVSDFEKKYKNLIGVQKEIFDLLMDFPDKNNIPEPFNKDQAFEICQYYDKKYITDKIYLLTKKLENKDKIARPNAWLYDAIKKDYREKIKKDDQNKILPVENLPPAVAPKNHNKILSYLSEKRIIAVKNGPDNNFYIAKYYLNRFFDIRKRNNKTEKNDFLQELTDLKSQDENNLIPEIIKKFDFPVKYAEANNLNEFLRVWSEL